MTTKRGSWLLAGALVVASAPCAAALPDFDTVQKTQARSDAQLCDRHGELLHELRTNSKMRQLEWVSLKDVSPALIQAVVQAEDRRFYEHGGVDWTSLTAASLRALWQENPRGASTLTMQLVGWLDPALKPVAGRRDLAQKWQQIGEARELEKSWTKQQVLEAYLNLVSFRGELQGIAAAARGIFDKHPGGIQRSEALLLAALLRAPGAPPAIVAKRACQLGQGLQWEPDCSALDRLATEGLAGPFRVRPWVSDAPHVARLLLKNGQANARATLDAGLQRYAQGVLAHQLFGLSEERVKDGAVLVVDNQTGEVLAYVGNGGSGYIDGVKARRQAGSTLKPFLYELAIERKLLTAASVLNDAPVNLVTPTGLYVPQDYDHDFKGPVTVRTALGSSLNVPAVRTQMLVGAESFVARLRQVGLSDLTENGDYYGHSLALGSAEVTLWDLVNAYRTLANGGWHSPLTLVPQGDAPRRRVLDRDASFIVSDLLSDRSARGLTFGLESVLATPFWSAVKTGTSKDMRDNWCIGYSDRFTVGVWVGNFDGSAMEDVSGITGAAPVWLEIMRYLHKGQPSRPPRATPGVVASLVEFTPAVEAERREYFLTGTQTGQVRLPDRSEVHKAQIRYPGRGVILAFDPDIPDGHQKVFFKVTPAGEGYRIQIDNNSPSDMNAGWTPLTGHHRIFLLDDSGTIVDQSEFEVRGTLPPGQQSSGG